MYRCQPPAGRHGSRPLLLLALLAGSACFAPQARAQDDSTRVVLTEIKSARNFPAAALRGELVVTQPPLAKLNGQLVQLAPGARIFGPSHQLLLSGGLIGEPLLVHYTRDLYGNLKDVWVLNEVERANRLWPTTPAEAAAWRFNPGTQTWTKP
ncbi:hypothetical protein ACG0Z6_02310 [Roseateles sp. BYS180W]|uniref:Uncharacterized protein n=1 Tax=Roseateles rivi TaxID=3299028 RepID=A0ABW7FRW7_9BURK